MRNYYEFIVNNFPIVLLFVGFLSYITNSFLTKKILDIALNFKLFPVNARLNSLHDKPAVALGGISIFIVTFFSLLLLLGSGLTYSVGFILASCFILVITGIKDDLIGTSPRNKFLIQFISAFIFILNPDFSLGNLGGFLGFYLINPNLMSYGLGILFVVFLTNAFNFIDGIDGLCATISIICLSIFALLFYLSDEFLYCAFSVVLIGNLFSFLTFNFRKGNRKMILGDTGALLLGFLISVFALRLLEFHPLKPFPDYVPQNPIVLILIILLVPIIDTFRVLFLRIYKGKKPWIADREHIHHFLENKGYTHKEILFLLCCYQSIALFGIFSLNVLSNSIQHIYLILIFFNFLIYLNRIPIKKK